MIHKRITAFERSVNNILNGVLKLVLWRQPHPYLIQMRIKTHKCLVCLREPQLINELSPRTYNCNIALVRYFGKMRGKIYIQ